MTGKKDRLKRIMISTILVIISLIYAPSIQAANWFALPPYNVLWPLWSPVLSPSDALTGQPIPLLTHLNRDTILPVQPALAWDPSISQPFLLYNNPLVYFGGLIYFNQLFGFNSWPPPYMLSAETSFPFPITLPLGYSLLPPIDYNLMADLVPLVNSMFSVRYGVPIDNLLTVDLLYGL